MQLTLGTPFNGRDNEPQVIHVVYTRNRGVDHSDTPARPSESNHASSTVMQDTPAIDSLNPELLTQGPHSLRNQVSEPLSRFSLTNSINDSADYRECAMARSMEFDRQARPTSSSRLSDFAVPSSSNMLFDDPVDEQSTYLTPLRYSPGPSTVNDVSPTLPSGLFSHSQELEETEQAVGHASVHQTLLLPDAHYPEYMQDTLAYTSNLPPSQQNFYPLWTYVLEYWFPSTEGFEVVQNWDPKTSFRAQQFMQPSVSREDDSALPQSPKPSLAVFDSTSPTQPFLFVNIQNGMPVNQLSRSCAKKALEETFEMLRACSFCAGFKMLCVVSVVGARWNMVLRDVEWLEGESESGIDHVGGFEEDVTSPESYRVMGYCFEEMKKRVLCRRGVRRM